MKSAALVSYLMFLLIYGGSICRSEAQSPGITPAAPPAFSQPEPVTIQGYSGAQEDPTISPDGKYLFFDSHNDAGKPSYLYWAKLIDYKTFKFMGPIQGVNFPGEITLRGNYDRAHNFYFASTKFRTSCGMLVQGIFKDGVVTGITPVKGICAPPARWGDINVTLDAWITPNGNTLYFSDGILSILTMNGPQTATARIAIARRNADGSFSRLPNSDALFKNVNALGRRVYNSAPSPDGLSFYFTVDDPLPRGPEIYVATRASVSEPFGTPKRVDAADIVVPEQILHGIWAETGSFSPDGTHLYFHRVLNPSKSQIYVLTRRKVAEFSSLKSCIFICSISDCPLGK